MAKKKSTSLSGIVSWLTETTRAVFMMDHRSRIRFFNRGCVEITGCLPEAIIGKSCEYRSGEMENLSDRILHSLTPAAEVFQGQELFTRINFIDAHGNQRSLPILYLPLFNQSQELTAVLGLILELAEIAPQLSPAFSQALHSDLAAITQRLHLQYNLSEIISLSPRMSRVVNQIQLAKNSSQPVHLQGKTGTGKQYLAKLIHRESKANQRPFLTIECGKIPRSDQKRILNDAITHAGEINAPAAIFLKDVDQFSTDLQVWIAEIHQLKEWSPQCRLFSSSTVCINQLVEQDRFDKTFYFTISPLTISVPSLIEREEDFDLLCQFFIEENNKNTEKQLTGLSREASDEFRQYNWPGNVRELKQVIDEACELASGSQLSVEQFPFRFQTGKQAQQTLMSSQPVFKPLSSVLETVEKEEIERVLLATKGNKAQAAKLLGLTRAKFYRRIEALNIEE